MMDETIQKETIDLLDAQLIGCIFYIISLIIAIIIILDTKMKIENKNGLLTNEDAQKLLLFNKILIVILLLFFLILNYKGKEISKTLNQSTENNDLQILASYLSLIAGMIGLYITIKNYQDTSIQPLETENPYL